MLCIKYKNQNLATLKKILAKDKHYGQIVLIEPSFTNKDLFIYSKYALEILNDVNINKDIKKIISKLLKLLLITDKYNFFNLEIEGIKNYKQDISFSYNDIEKLNKLKSNLEIIKIDATNLINESKDVLIKEYNFNVKKIRLENKFYEMKYSGLDNNYEYNTSYLINNGKEILICDKNNPLTNSNHVGLIPCKNDTFNKALFIDCIDCIQFFNLSVNSYDIYELISKEHVFIEVAQCINQIIQIIMYCVNSASFRANELFLFDLYTIESRLKLLPCFFQTGINLIENLMKNFYKK